jgi:hypothetical protein
MTHDPGDAPVPDPPPIPPPDADVRETPSGARPPAEVTASDAGRPDVAASDLRRPEAPESGVGRPEAAGSDVGWSESAASDVGHPESAWSDVGHPESAGSDVGRREVRAADVGRPEGAAPGGPDPYETTRLPVTPTPDPRFADTPRPAGDPAAAAPNRAGGTRVGAALFFDDRLTDGQSATHPHDADDASGRTVVDDAPTEAMAVVDAGGRHRAERGGDTDADPGTEWRPPRQTSRLTTVLVIALLVAIGFLAGVFVGRSAAPAPSGEQPRPAATSPARPGALR